VKRSRSSTRRQAGWKRVLASPFTPVLIGLALVLGVGFWAMRETPTTDDAPPPEPAAAAQTEAGSGVGEPAGEAAADVLSEETRAESSDEAPDNTPDNTQHETPDAAQDATPDAAPASAAEGLTDSAAGEPTAPPAPAGDTASRGQIDRSGGASETMLVTAYFADGLQQGPSLQPVQIKVPFDLAVIKATARQIVDPPEQLSLFSSVPPGTQVLETNLKDGVAIVNLSAALEEVQGTAAVNNIRASFVYSLTSIPGVEAVQLWTEGRPAVLDGYEWSRPVTRAEIESEGLYAVQDLIPYSGP